MCLLNKEKVLLNVYGTSGCHLCDDVDAMLSLPKVRGLLMRHEISLNMIDIVSQEQIFERYARVIPVVGLEGAEEELAWPFSILDLCRYIEGSTRLS